MNRRSLEVLAWSTAAVGLLATPAAAAGSSGSKPGPNPGTVWLAGEPTAGHGHDPHVGCGSVALWGDKLAATGGSYAVTLWPPTGERPAVLDGTWAYTSPGPEAIAAVDGDELARRAGHLGAEPHPQQGYHFKLDLEQAGHHKHKTFWVDCPAEPEAAGVTDPAVVTEPPAELSTERTEAPPAEGAVTLSAALEEPAPGEVVVAAALAEPVGEEPQAEVLGESIALDETALPVTGGSWALLTTLAILLVGLGAFLLDCAGRARDVRRRLLDRSSQL